MTKYNFHSMANIEIYKRRAVNFRAGSHHFLDISFQISSLEKVGHGRGMQFLRCYSFMANFEIYKSRWMQFFALALTVSEISPFQICYLEKIKVKGPGVHFSQ